MDTCDLIGPRELAVLLDCCYGTVHRLTRMNPRFKACAVTTGGTRPRYRYSLTLLRQAGFLRAVPEAVDA